MNKKELRLDSKTLGEIRNFLARDTEDSDMEADEVLHRFFVDFGNGTTADLEVCNGDPPYCSGQLYQNGKEVCVIATDDGIEGPWVFDGSDGFNYTVVVMNA